VTLVATAAAATSSATTAAALILGPSFVDDEGATIELLTIQSIDGGRRVVFLRHRHETETTGAASITIGDDSDFFDFTVLAKEVSERFLRGSEVQITHVNFQRTSSSPLTLTMSGSMRGVQGKG